MAPPPVTPSPHRFVVQKPAKPAQTQQAAAFTNRDSVNRSEGRFNAVPKFSSTASQSPAQHATQFVNTSEQRNNQVPRFSSQTPAATRSNVTVFPSTPSLPSSYSRFAISARKSSLRSDAIEDASEEEDGDIEALNEEDEEVVPTIETGGHGPDSSHDVSERRAKRRRISTSETRDESHADNPEKHHVEDEGDEEMLFHSDRSESGDVPSSSLPDVDITTPIPLKRDRRIPDSSHAIHTPRFLVSTPRPSEQDTVLNYSSLSSKPQPPKFAPIDSEQNNTNDGNDPVPDIFSPRRRGQRYVPGGLAEELTSWLFDIGSESQSAVKQNRDEEHYDVKVSIEEVSGGPKSGMTLIRGRQLYNDSSKPILNTPVVVQFILTGEGIGRGVLKQEVERGKVVGIKKPMWEIMLEGQKWTVAVSWKVMNS